MRKNLTLAILPVALFIFISAPAFSQTSRRDEKTYRKTSTELREDIWGWNLPQFKNYSIPESLKTKSSVVLARYTDLSAESARSVRRSTNITQITRELIKLNDAAAIMEYSELSYTQLRKSRGLSMDNIASVFLGVRVIKGDGKITEINTDDIVLTKDERKERQAKLAIPDLQPGDMLDYYVAKELSIEQQVLTTMPYYFSFFDDVPVLHYGVHCAIGKRFATEYRCYNGAPDFKNSEDDDHSTILDVSADNLMLVPSGTFWISPMRQFPVIQLNIVQASSNLYGSRPNARKPGELFRNQAADRIIKDELIDINSSKYNILALLNANVPRKSGPMKDYYKALKERKKTMPADSLVAELYYLFRFEFLFDKQGVFDVEDFVNTPKQSFNTSMLAFLLSEYFKKHDLEAELVLATSTYAPKMAEVLNKADISYLCNVHEGHDILLGMHDFYSPAFYIPAAYENVEEAVAVDTKGSNILNSSYYTQRKIQTSHSDAKDNVHAEQLFIRPDLGNNQLLITRNTSLTGHFKESVQPHLLLLEDFYNYERKFYNDERTLEQRLEESRKSRKVVEELTAAFANARKAQKEAFMEEAKDWMELEITDQKDIKISNPGVRHIAPSFDYASSFQVNSALKQAGNNFLVEVGKLIGNPTKVEDEKRNRTMDIYGPFARTVRIEMDVEIPEGYSVEGVDELNKSLKNGAGSFTTSLSLNGNAVHIVTERVFTAARYPAKDWPQLLAIMDAAADWTNAKLLLRKKA